MGRTVPVFPFGGVSVLVQGRFRSGNIVRHSKAIQIPVEHFKAISFRPAVEAKFINVENRGQVPVPFTATLSASGDVENPKITNAATGKFLLINKTIVSGERLIVEITHDRTTVTSSVDGDCRGALSLKSTLFQLEVGDNVLKPEATSGLANLQVDIDFATEIVGISL